MNHAFSLYKRVLDWLHQLLFENFLFYHDLPLILYAHLLRP